MDRLAYSVRGFALTDRMLDMRIIGMKQSEGGWVAEFADYPGVQFPLPKPVADWLLDT